MSVGIRALPTTPDGGFIYEPLSKGRLLFSRSGSAIVTLSKRSLSAMVPRHELDG